MKTVRFLQIFSISILFAAFNLSLHAQVVAIKAGKLVDPDAGTVATNQVILVDGQTIKAVGSQLAIPANAKVIDLSSMTVLPGLTDSHTHMLLTFHPKIDGNYYMTTPLRSTART